MNITAEYEELLEELERRFQAVRRRHPDEIACGSGCADCCHGLFDIALVDALRLTRSYAALPPETRRQVEERAARLQKRILETRPDWAFPYLIDAAGQPEIDRLTEAMPDARCPLLDERDLCLIYNDRPLACRLEGLPMVDLHDGLFDDWCERNFLNLVNSQNWREASADFPQELINELRLDFYEINATEQKASAALSALLTGAIRDDLTVLIPSVITAFPDFWQPALARLENAP